MAVANILRDTEGNVKLGDFGTSKQLTSMTKLTSICGTWYYMCPEIIREVGYEYKTDIWWDTSFQLALKSFCCRCDYLKQCSSRTGTHANAVPVLFYTMETSFSLLYRKKQREQRFRCITRARQGMTYQNVTYDYMITYLLLKIFRK